MNIVIPMGGKDPRFAGSFKAFSDVGGEPLIKRIMGGLRIDPCDQLIFIVLKDDEQIFGVSKKVSSLFGKNIVVRYLDGPTRGSPESIITGAKDLINNDDGLLIELGDVFRDTKNLYKDIESRAGVAGIIPVEGRLINGKLWGYVSVDGDRALKLHEKESVPSAPWATMGLYYFSHGKDFVWAAEEMMDKRSFTYKDVFFVGPAYNELIKRGDKIAISENKIIAVLGGPEDIENFKEGKPTLV